MSVFPSYLMHCLYMYFTDLGPVVQSIFNLMSSLRGQPVKHFATLLLNTLIFFVEKMKKAFAPKEAIALQKLLTIFLQKYWHFRYKRLKL